MTAEFSSQFVREFAKTPERVQKDFGKQFGLLLKNRNHPSLRTKKFDESRDVWQARGNKDRRCSDITGIDFPLF